MECFKTAGTCYFPGCYGTPRKDTVMCKGSEHHLQVQADMGWKQPDVDELIKARTAFEQIRTTVIAPESIYDKVVKKYVEAMGERPRKLVKIPPWQRPSDANTATGGGSEASDAKKARLENVQAITMPSQFAIGTRKAFANGYALR